MGEPRILLYAELLPNIRQISVMVALDSPCSPATNGGLSAGGRQIVLKHDNEELTLDLPGQTVLTTQLQKPVIGSKEISWRLPVAGLLSGTSIGSTQSNDAPWSAKDLGPHSEFYCRRCGAVIVRRGSIKTWKDLPSENWAEMMDFWHCHKPDTETDRDRHKHNEDPNASRGYGANTKFIAQPGIGFVDLTSFLLADPDCQNLQTTSPEGSQTHLPTVSCTYCQACIGHLNPQSCGLELHKWSLTGSSSTSSRSSLISSLAPSISVIISARLLSLLQSQCTSKFVIIPQASSSLSSPTLHFWILQQSLFISKAQSGASRGTSQNSSLPMDSRIFVMKVLWKRATDKETLALLDSGKAEDVVLPSSVITDIENCLRESARYLPPSARTFQGWNVGLLERYEDEK